MLEHKPAKSNLNLTDDTSASEILEKPKNKQPERTPLPHRQIDTEIISDAQHILSEYLGMSIPHINHHFIVLYDDTSQEALPYYRAPYIYIPSVARECQSQYLSVVVHEMLHKLSANRIYKPTNQHNIKAHLKVGFSNSVRDINNKYRTLFSALNEGMTEELTMRAVKHSLRHINSKPKTYGKTKSPGDMDRQIYSNERKLLNAIIQKIAVTENRTEKEVFKDLKHAYFSGSLYSLRSVEEAFGTGALRDLANIDISDDQTKPWTRHAHNENPYVQRFLGQ